MPYKEGEKWRGLVTYRGKRYSKTHLTKQSAKDWEAEKRKELKSTQPLTSLRTIAAKYLSLCEKQFRPNTFVEKRTLLRQLGASIGNVSIESISSEDLQTFIYSFDTPNKCNRARRNLLAFFNYCARFHGLRDNPVQPIALLKHSRAPQPVPTESEVLQLLMACDRHDRNFLVFLATTGARRSEALRLTWEDINFERATCRLWNRKGRGGTVRERYVPLNERALAALRDQYSTRLPHSNHVFQNRDPRHPNYGSRYTTRRRFMSGLCKRAKIKKRIRFHAFRRFFASMLADSGKVSLATIQRLLGHASASTTDHYIHVLHEDVRFAVDVIELKTPIDHTQKTAESL